ncbi:MAG: YaaA family protein [Candidatus Izemoplasmatales bacterium]|jgi:cytoplasmic iron level regulating protein YaaA (DUF328/UPF0246 family)|nr:YaaA family protein [Candidatus Izemoplasmatales bacterium]
MKIIISPSKTQNFNFDNQGKSELKLKKETKLLFSKLKSLSKEELSYSLKIKKKLLDETYSLYQLEHKVKPVSKAIDSYSGVVFEQLSLSDYNSSQINYLNNHLNILSAIYGTLSPEDLIYPYRLDMTNKISDINLYNFWQEDIDKHFSQEDVIINLASNEFSRMLKNHSEKIINIDFFEKDKDGKLKIISYNAKKARGQMLDFLIRNKIENIELIKQYSLNGYKYSENLSKGENLVFVKGK